MKHYDFAPKFRALYDQALGLYAKGQREAGTLFSANESAWLAANGLSAQNFYDYVEDHAEYGEPGPENALAIEIVRRDYFLTAQQGRPSGTVIDSTAMLGKSDAVRGIEWLPRLIPKAKAKLRGELPASLMYCCGGDRKFFRTHDIMPAEFLAVVWRHEKDDHAVVDWVVRRIASLKVGP